MGLQKTLPYSTQNLRYLYAVPVRHFRTTFWKMFSLHSERCLFVQEEAPHCSGKSLPRSEWYFFTSVKISFTFGAVFFTI